MFKRLLILLLTMVGIGTLQAQDAPKVDQILESYFATIGGIDKWRNLEATKMTGRMAMGGMEFPGTVYAKKPNLQRVEVNVQGQQIVQAFNGEEAWWINPFQTGTTPQTMPDEMATEYKKFEFENDFIDYEKRGHTVTYAGEETIEGAKTYALKINKANGDEMTYYFDSETFVPIMMKKVVDSGPMKGQYAETYMSDYQEVGDYIMPYFIEMKVGGSPIHKITITDIELNPALDNAMFSRPK